MADLHAGRILGCANALARDHVGDVHSWCTNRCATFCAPSTGIQWKTSATTGRSAPGLISDKAAFRMTASARVA
jgi:hypothetical protein